LHTTNHAHAGEEKLKSMQTAFERKLSSIECGTLTEDERSERIRAAVTTYRGQLLDLQRLCNASDDEAEAALAERELARIDDTFPPPPPPPTPLPGGLETELVLHYSFDRPEGNKVTDGSDHANHGIVNSAVWSPAGRLGGACYLGETGAYIETPSAPSLCATGSISISVTVRSLLPPDSTQYLVSKSDQTRCDYWLRLSASRSLAAGFRPASDERQIRVSPAAENRGNVDQAGWTHLAFTYDGREARTYVNGRLDGHLKTHVALASSDAPLNIGRHGNGRWYYGSPVSIDDVMIWNRALTEVEVLGLSKWLEM
jgi:hypothetical protein